ncbi:uncharacterized protein VTP21DRAFT_8749 [Calcarisporiella thermophila]|uniref:uncharacterized protein n=1 Tax=Calcarisporiella thermophila TaxID=911321 RepID=UPI00374382FA
MTLSEKPAETNIALGEETVADSTNNSTIVGYDEKGTLPTHQKQGEENNQVKRHLNGRHLAMISIGGTIGTGLFLASGNSVAVAGPAGALIAYGFMGMMVYFMMGSLGEMATYMPISGSFNHYAGRFIDPALGFAMGWNYFFSWSVTLASELSAASLVIAFWTTSLHSVVWCAIFLGCLLVLNSTNVRFYGEAEYWLSLVKVVTCMVFIVVGILLDAGAIGGETIGDRYWKDPGPFNNGALGTFNVLLVAGYSFQGTEIVGITAGESRNPRKNVPRAIKTVFVRIFVFMIASILLIGLIIPSNDPNLLQAGANNDITIAPFTIVFQRAGWAVAAHIMNFIVLITVLTAGNCSLYAASRTLYAMADEGKAPSIFGRVTKWGVPMNALLFSTLLSCLCMLAAVFRSQDVFTWLVSLTSVTGFISWLGIAASHYRFRLAYLAQGRRLEDLPYVAAFFPFGPLFAIFVCLVIIFGSGWENFKAPFNVVGFIAAYIGPFLMIVIYAVYKIVKRTKFVPIMEVDLDTDRYIPTKEDEEENAIPEPMWQKILAYIF